MVLKFINEIKLNKKKYKKIYFFPFNVQSRYLYKKIKSKKSYFIDNYEPTSKIIIRPNKIEDNANNLLIISDINIEKYLQIKLTNIKKIYKSVPIDSDIGKRKIDLDKKKSSLLSLSKLFLHYNTDKAKFYTRLSFKDKSHNYGPHYDKMFKSLRNKELKILEIGIFRGASTAAFHNYFKNSKICVLDRDKKIFKFKSKRIKFFKSNILNNISNFFSCLKSNSFYVIEDFGLKFDYLNDIKKEPDIFTVIKSIKLKKNYKSKIINKTLQNDIIKKVDFIKVCKGSWVKSGKNVSDICFLKMH